MLKLTLRTVALLFVFLAASAVYAQSAVYAELSTSLDSTSTKANDPISAKLRSSVKLPDGTKLPGSTVLTGHIVAVKDGAQDSISFVFDKAMIDSENTINVHVVVRRLDVPPMNRDDTSEDSRDVKKDGAPVSKLRNVTLQVGTDNESAVVVSKGKSLRLESKTLLGCLVSAA